MATKKYKPATAGFRDKQVSGYEELTQTVPEKPLLSRSKKHAGRNNTGRLTVRHRGGGSKKRYRLVDFKRLRDGIEGIVKSIEYDPFRTAFIAKVYYSDGRKDYILAPAGLKVGDSVMSGASSDIKTGNTLPLSDIPSGSIIHNVELVPNRGGQLARSAGASAVLMAKSGNFATVKLPSGEVRLVHLKCRATLGSLSNAEARNVVLGRAGTSRHLGRRPHVRGAVMNPCDHPHGGGEGRAPVGRPSPLTPWGRPVSAKTRRKRNKHKYLVKARK